MLSPGHAGVIHRALCEDSQSSAADPASSSSAPSHAYPPSRVVRPRLSPALASHLNLGWAVANFEGTPVHSGSIAVKISARRFVRIELQSCAWGPRKLIHEPLRLQPLKSSPKISQSHRAVDGSLPRTHIQGGHLTIGSPRVWESGTSPSPDKAVIIPRIRFSGYLERLCSCPPCSFPPCPMDLARASYTLLGIRFLSKVCRPKF